MDISCISISELKKIIRDDFSGLDIGLLDLMKNDSRKGVQKLCHSYYRLEKEREQNRKKAEELIKEEKKLWSQGYKTVAGIDEAGRGPLAGPVVAACVIFPNRTLIEGIDDSKKLSPLQRERLYGIIMEEALAVGIGKVGAERIDKINILNATYEAMYQAISNCLEVPDFLLIDAVNLKNCNIPQLSIIKGDARSQTIAAASIIAKVYRDREMDEWSYKYPQYHFEKHKGYGTSQHIQAIKTYGLSPIHRRSFTSSIL